MRKHSYKTETKPAAAPKYDFEAVQRQLDALAIRIQELRQECEETRKELEKIRTFDRITPVIESPVILENDDPCAGCVNKPRVDQIQIGDSPCQWCSHSPWKITCSTVTTTPSTHYSHGELVQLAAMHEHCEEEENHGI